MWGIALIKGVRLTANVLLVFPSVITMIKDAEQKHVQIEKHFALTIKYAMLI